MTRILFASVDPREQETVRRWLSAAGHHIVVCGDFECARRQLDAHRPDLLIAAVRLGDHNGLHLAIRARFTSSPIPAAVIGDPDPVLQAEASRLETTYLTYPLDGQQLLRTVSCLLAQERPTRRSARKRIDRVGALLNGEEAALVDISYEGLRLEVPPAHIASLPDVFTLRVPVHNVACRAQRVWVRGSGAEGEPAWCGATLAPSDASAARAWRAFVDATPGVSLASG